VTVDTKKCLFLIVYLFYADLRRYTAFLRCGRIKKITRHHENEYLYLSNC
jgi:hypothetical protein